MVQMDCWRVPGRCICLFQQGWGRFGVTWHRWHGLVQHPQSAWGRYHPHHCADWGTCSWGSLLLLLLLMLLLKDPLSFLLLYQFSCPFWKNMNYRFFGVRNVDALEKQLPYRYSQQSIMHCVWFSIEENKNTLSYHSYSFIYMGKMKCPTTR